jgi:surface antigen
MLLITTFVVLHVVAGGSRTWAGRPYAVSGRLMLIHTCHAHAALCRDLEKSLSERHGHGMACVNQMGKTQSKPLVVLHGMCELTFIRH